jgi:DNA-binding beta-propeller fold protein YncE
MRLWLALTAGTYGSLLLSCAAGTVKQTSESIDSKLPVAVVVQQEISGYILSQTLKQPAGLAVDKFGYLYLCDQGNNRIIKFDSNLIPLREAGGYGNEDGLFKRPVDIVVDDDNRVLVSDASNRRIQQLDTALYYRTQMRLEDSDDPLKFGTPSGLAVTHDGSLRIADNERNDLIFLTNNGVFEKLVGDLGYRGGQLSDPQGVAVDREDNVFVCDAGNGRVAVYDKYAEFQRAISPEGLIRPVSILIDHSNRLWILDQSTNQIFLCRPDGKLSTTQPIPIFGANPPIEKVHGLAFLKDGRLLITDTGNNRLLVCKLVFGSGD